MEMKSSRCPPSAGYTLLDLTIAMAVGATLVGLSVPRAQAAVDEIRTAGAARHLAECIALARFEALKRSSAYAWRFVADGADYRFTAHIDSNGNGVRTAEISSGIDATIGHSERVGDKHAGTRLRLLADVPDLDGVRGNEDGVRIGSSRILTVAPDGSATSGSLYVAGAQSQYAVRVLGATGRTRVFRFDRGRQQWEAR
jgi:Tfp pilus assembly protein FimT